MNLLTIGGSDPSSGAGIQSDVKIFSSLKAYPLTVITAITSQNTANFEGIEPISSKMVKNQLKTIFSDFKIDGIKIGMVFDSQIIKVLHKELKKLKIPIVVDPVIKSTTGGRLIKDSAIQDFQKFIIPLATIITPNQSEASILTNIKIKTKQSALKTAKRIQEIGAENVIITGVETKGDKITDIVVGKNAEFFISNNKINSTNHGSGCSHSAFVLFSFVKNKDIKISAKFANKETRDAIKNAEQIGKGVAMITNIKKEDPLKLELTKAIEEFTEIKNIYKNIPECQTNFVFTKAKPISTDEILGISGRIVKTGKEVTVAGNLEYGGSKHVATALLAFNKKFPNTHSAINLKYQKTVIKKIEKSGMRIAEYDRTQEPKKVKNKGSTIEWGTKTAIKNLEKPPDIIYHKGDFGKEPMIIVYGNDPQDVLKKISIIV